MPNQASIQTIKRLFAESGNICAFPKCTLPIVSDSTVVGEVCHIKGKKPDSQRYEEAQSDADRHGYDNLILMCSMHHTIIDSDEQSYSVKRLHEIKSEHTMRAKKLPDEEAGRGAQIISTSILSLNQESEITGSATASSGNINFAPVINVGNIGALPTPPRTSSRLASEGESAVHIELLAVETRPIYLDEGIWRIGQLPDWRAMALLLPFYLDPRKSSPGARVEYATCHLVFVGERSISTRIPHGCWINASLDSTDMRPGDTKYLILIIGNDDSSDLFCALSTNKIRIGWEREAGDQPFDDFALPLGKYTVEITLTWGGNGEFREMFELPMTIP